MKQENHDAFTDDIPAYVLGALGRAEASVLERHLKSCPVCRAELKRFQQVGNGLLTALPLKTPSIAIKQKLLARIDRREASVQWNNHWKYGQYAIVLTMVVLVIGNVFSLLKIHELHQQQIQLTGRIEKNHTILAMLTSNTEIYPVSSDAISGNLLLDREKNLSYLLVWNMQSPPADSVYQIWLVGEDGERVDAGTFLPDADWPFTSTSLITMHAFTEFVGIEVTIEPSGGSDKPTGEQIMNATY